MNEYEKQREENIRKNNELLVQLGLDTVKHALEKKSATPGPESTIALGSKRKREHKADLRPSRKSTRSLSKGATKPAQNAQDKKGHVKIPRLELRRLPAAAPPSGALGTPFPSPAPKPARDSFDAGGTIRFEPAWSHFTPNLTPAEMLRAGAFGGTAFKPFNSRVIQCNIPADYSEYPEEWFRGLDPETHLISTDYLPSSNKYGVKAGQTIEEWEKSGWVHEQDPRGWFQWYARFYLGRRTDDDERQVKRWSGVCGPNGRFKKALVKRIAQSGGNTEDVSVAPVLRQTLLHWGYQLTETDYRAYL